MSWLSPPEVPLSPMVRSGDCCDYFCHHDSPAPFAASTSSTCTYSSTYSTILQHMHILQQSSGDRTLSIWICVGGDTNTGEQLYCCFRGSNYSIFPPLNLYHHQHLTTTNTLSTTPPIHYHQHYPTTIKTLGAPPQ